MIEQGVFFVNQRNIAIVGAGITGLVAAYRLAQAGHHVAVYEANTSVGGLAGGFRKKEWEWALDYYYHHIFGTDRDILDLADELGITDQVLRLRPTSSWFFRGDVVAFDSPMALLRFPGLSIIDKVRMGAVLAYLKITKRWKNLEQHKAHEWLKRWMGRGYNVLWKPLLESKFGAYAKEVNMAWFWARIHTRTTELLYFAGGFQAFCDKLAEGVQRAGGTLVLNTPVQALEHQQGKSGQWLLTSSTGDKKEFDQVLVTTAPSSLQALVKTLPATYVSQLENLRSIGVVVLIFSLKQSVVEQSYWVTLTKEEGFPFVVFLEHTNFIGKENYNNEILVYCGDYIADDHPYATASKEELITTFLTGLQKLNPQISREDIIETWLYRTPYAQPVPFVGQSKIIPDIKTPLDGLFYCSMSQVYPWDRGTNYSVAFGERVAEKMLSTDESL